MIGLYGCKFKETENFKHGSGTVETPDAQLLELKSTDGLSIQQIERRIALVKLQTEERGLDVANVANEKHIAEKEQALRQWRAKCADIAAQQAEEARIQSLCQHNTGGKDRRGFYAGDGEIYGKCVSRQILPTGESYALCFRCEKEWHHPNFIEKYYPGFGSEKLSGREAVIKGAMQLSEYLKLEAEWKAAMGWKARTFEIASGELPESVRFQIPALQERHDREAKEFKEFLGRVPEKDLNAARAYALGIQ